MNKLLLLSLFTVSLILAACTDPTVIGGGLIEGNQLAVEYRDDVPVRLITMEAENNSLTTGIQDTEGGVAFGCINSAYTGDLNSRVGMEIVEPGFQLDLTTAVVDSIVLVLPLNLAFQQGDTNATASIRVLGATAESFTDLEPVSSTSLLDNGVVLGEITAVPPRTQTVGTVFAGDSTRVDSVGPELRIPLNQDFSDLLLPALAASIARDSIINDSLFLSDFPGIIVEGSDCGATLPAIDLSLIRGDRMGVFVYYTDDGAQRQYQLNYRRGSTSVGTLRPEYIHNFAGSAAAELLSGSTLGDTIALLQSLSGLMVKVDFPDLSSLDDQAVNAAFLEIPLIQGTEEVIAALPRIIVRVRNDIGDLIDYSAGAIVGDSIVDGTREFNLSSAEGGDLITIADPRNTASDSILAYRFNLTTFFQEVLTGERPQEIFLLPRFQSQLPGESILVGPGGDITALRARLLLATTELP